MGLDEDVTVEIEVDADIVTARQAGRRMATAVGFSDTDATMIATAISEVARNITAYCRRGVIRLNVIEERHRHGVYVVAEDEGPGIADVARAMQDGYSTRQGLGLGLPGARRLMDDFEITSVVGRGTTVVMRKWLRRV